ncbi:MAG TPA: hypothetical protein VHG51_04360 [Longimicrobiaceae bacterium]|nr:hypothetical protein [Longimicrobiaceae bacterium]
MTRTRSILFAAAVLGALGFGATQALAAPSTPPDSEARFCGPDCRWQGYYCICW